MTATTPSVVQNYFDASAARDVAALVACFTADARVADDGKEYVGLEAIRDWKASTDAAFEYTTEIIGSEKDDLGYLVTATIAGDFPGSPVDLRYRFVLADNLISELQIAP
ncbi:MAG: nuclear transport factor 2 family protein [Candidatus Nanopelagicales bacterium]